MPEKVRQSNMELLRLVAMLLVMVLHADFATFGFPRPRLVASAPLSWFEMILTECLALCSVNVFVLITGWFGTRFRLIGLVRLLSQVVFVTFFVFETLWIVDGRLPGGWQDAFSGIYGYWFINSYLLLYLFSPVLNAYVTQVGERDFRRLILVLWAFIIPASFFYEDLNYGYSTVFFLLLYLTGRYARLYLAERLARVPTRAFLLFYFLSSCSLAVLYWVLLYAFGINPGFLVGAYSNPFHVFSALSLLFFSVV